jgi:hypothetical protein
MVTTLHWSQHKLLICCVLGSSITVLSFCSLQSARSIQLTGVVEEPKQVVKVGAYEIQFFAAGDDLPASIMIAKSNKEACSIKIDDGKLSVMIVRKRDKPSQTCDLLPTLGEFEAVKSVQESNTVEAIYDEKPVKDDQQNEIATDIGTNSNDMTQGAVGDGYSAVDELDRTHGKTKESKDSCDSSTSIGSANSTHSGEESCSIITEKDLLSTNNNESYDFMLLRIGKDVDEKTIIENGTCQLGSKENSNTKSLR